MQSHDFRMTEPTWYVLDQGDTEPKGPYTEAQLRDLVRTGKISPGARANQAGTDEWVAISSSKRDPEPRAEAAETARQEAERRASEDRGRLVPQSALAVDCFATQNLVTCHATNLSSERLVTCVQGVVTQKEAAGVRLSSMPLCSGPVAPLQTVSFEGTFVGGRASDLCRDARGFLDWDECHFNVNDFDVLAKR
jgi:hypothetical protein